MGWKEDGTERQYSIMPQNVTGKNNMHIFFLFLCRYQRIFQKKSSRWSAFPVKAPKTYSYIPDLVKSIVVRRVEDNVGMSQPFELERDDPRRISAHLAPLPPPSTLQIVSE